SAGGRWRDETAEHPPDADADSPWGARGRAHPLRGGAVGAGRGPATGLVDVRGRPWIPGGHPRRHGVRHELLRRRVHRAQRVARPAAAARVHGDMAQIGVSGQVKYWIDIPGTANRLKVVPEAGIGFVHTGFRNDDTSWLIVLGAGADYRLNNQMSVTGTLLLNFTNLDTDRA